MQLSSSKQSRGRRRGFDPDCALEIALDTFRRKGYEGASVDDLTDAMGISKPSMYRVFGNKEALFNKAMNLYEANIVSFSVVALREPTARKEAESFLQGALDAQTRTGPKGCLGVLGSMAYSDDSHAVRANVLARLGAARAALASRLELARQLGDLPGNDPIDGLVSFLYALVHGMAVQAAAGVDRTALEDIIELGLRAWPASGIEGA